jgi:formylglycine-generating enzyme required for sulfatase activity
MLPLLATGAVADPGARAAHSAQPAAGSTFRDCPDCPLLVVVPPGEFTMGSTDGDPDRPETPVHAVHIGYAFAVGRTPVTNAEFSRFVDATHHAMTKGCIVIKPDASGLDATADWRDPGYGRAPRDDEPVVCVRWLDAKAYAAWLTRRTGHSYRLLSEAEWEYAARAGTTTRFPWGDDPHESCRHANLYDSSAGDLKMPYPTADCDDGYPRVAPVASFPPNAFGLYDMLGNVWQWTEDCYLFEYPEWPVDGTPVEVRSACPLRSIRGGSWATRVDRLRTSWRGRDPEWRMNVLFGFRIARDLTAVTSRTPRETRPPPVR